MSVIVPTRNRRPALGVLLEALCTQTWLKEAYEVILVDDGGCDGTQEYAQRMSGGAPFRLIVLRQDHRGPAAARNLAAREARGTVLLFLNDDVVPDHGLVETHARLHAHLGPEDGVVGCAPFPVDWQRTPLIQYIERAESRCHLRDGQMLTHRHFVTNNLSLKRAALFEVGLFDERIDRPVGEDIDLGYRLERRGFHLYYSQDAVVHHRHVFDRSSYALRMRAHGHHAATYSLRLNPEYKLDFHGGICEQFLPLRTVVRTGGWRALGRWFVGKAILSQSAGAGALLGVEAAEMLGLRVGLQGLYRIMFLHSFALGVRDGVRACARRRPS